MLFLADQGLPEFLHVQGLHALLPHLYVNGNRPDPARDTVIFGLAAGAIYLLLALAATFRLTRREREQDWSRARRRTWRVLVFLAFFVAWELSLQAWSAGNPYETYVADPVRFWSARPDPSAKPLTVERLDGFFDADYTPERAPGRYRIMFLGDSQAISIQPIRYAGARTYPKALAGLDVAGPHGEPLETINAAVSGYSSWQGLLLLRSLGVKYRPDLVVAAFGYHDSARAFSPDAQVMTDDPRVHFVRSVLYRSKIYLLVRQIALRRQSAENDRQAAGALVERVPLPDFEANLRAMARLGREKGFRVALLLEPFRDPAVWDLTRTHRETALRVAREEGLPVLDLFTPFAALSPAERCLLFNDDIHMTAAGHRLASRMVAEDLEKAGLLRAP